MVADREKEEPSLEKQEVPQGVEAEGESAATQEKDLPSEGSKKRPADIEVDEDPVKKRKVDDGPLPDEGDTEELELDECKKKANAEANQQSTKTQTVNDHETSTIEPPKPSPKARGSPAAPHHHPPHIYPMLPFPAGMFPPHHGGTMMNPYMNFPMPEGMIFPGNMPMPGVPIFHPPYPIVSSGIPLSLPSDTDRLSEYQTYLRQQFEFFQASPLDAQSSAQGRKRAVVVGQGTTRPWSIHPFLTASSVGLRCRHCVCLPLRSRGRGSVYFPSSLLGIYQAGQNMAGSHLATSCPRMPPQMKQELLNLRSRRDNASGGKQYWADGARALGIYEAPSGGLRLKNDGRPRSRYQPPARTYSPPSPAGTDDSKVTL